MKKFEKISKMQMLSMRFSGGAGGNADPATDPLPAADPPPAVATPATTSTTAAKTYTDVDIEAAKVQALAEYKQHQEDAKDYEKMTAEEKVVYLEAQRIDDKLTQATTAKLAAQGLPTELLQFVKGKDEADTDAKIKAVKGIIDKTAQAGVDRRFKENGYLPKGSAVSGEGKDEKPRERGVKVQ